MTAEHLRTPIRPDWDVPLTYDLLKSAKVRPGIFVGREDLLLPLVTSIVEPDKPGTILISGYRGSGKTTLIIEALLRSNVILSKRVSDAAEGSISIMPVVLNVSEIANSLLSRETTPPRLQVDPKRLLIALLRAFRQRSECIKNEELQNKIDTLYVKATASEFKAFASTSSDESEATERTSSASADLRNLMTILIGPAGIVSLGIASLNAPTNLFGDILRSTAILLSGLAALFSLKFSAKIVKKQTSEKENRLSITHDNSLQQLENDLRDLLSSLRHSSWRPIIVLEELDKLDAGGEELDQVIRYFKNIFTQSPALFIFVTDKNYYDRIENEVKAARRDRTYAVSHTFFTHRIFVGRPSTRDCIEFIDKLLLDPKAKNDIKSIYTSKRFALETSSGEVGRTPSGISTLNCFVRVVLFRATNHMFDLKAELQRFVRVDDEGAALQYDQDLFPEEDYPIAKFQDLVVEKFETFKFKGAKFYANELLQDCLTGVFHDFGHGRRRVISELVPTTGSEECAPLNAAEQQRLVDAVDSLLKDLERGRAIRRSANEFVDNRYDALEWLSKPAETFSLVRRLEKHEEDLLARLTILSYQAKLLSDEMVLTGMVDGSATVLYERIRKKIERTTAREITFAVEDVDIEVDNTQNELTRLLSMLLDSIVERSEELHAFDFENIPTGVFSPGYGIRILRSHGKKVGPASDTDNGVVALILGSYEGIHEEVKGLTDRLAPRRISIVQLTSISLDRRARERLQQRWIEIFSRQMKWKSNKAQLQVVVRSLEDIGSLHDDSAPRALARDLVAAASWSYPPNVTISPDVNFLKETYVAIKSWLMLPTGKGARLLYVDDVESKEFLTTVMGLIWLYAPEVPWVLPVAKVADIDPKHDFDNAEIVVAVGDWLDHLLGVPASGFGDKHSVERTARLFELIGGPTDGVEGVLAISQPLAQIPAAACAALASTRWIGTDLRHAGTFHEAGRKQISSWGKVLRWGWIADILPDV